ncbi:MAG: hypothetical protein C3F13_16320 [Anaerolineales bacterium]|nr:MAG: hypothetical protein C3F13_16320 [Anaerolineales bacterium]
MINNYIRIPDPDLSIYRYFRLKYFEDGLNHKNIMLVNPCVWEDPMELVGGLLGIYITEKGKRTQKFISYPFTRIYAQCWSMTKESDTLLRAYSRVAIDPDTQRNSLSDDEGVSVRTTPRKLFNALELGITKTFPGFCYIGSVKYLSSQELTQTVANAFLRGTNVFDNPINLAELALLKRDAFAHESEVRLLFISEYAIPNVKNIEIPIDPNTVYDSITFDPRLEIFQRLEHEAKVRDLGFTGTFIESDLYHRIELQVDLTDNNR